MNQTYLIHTAGCTTSSVNYANESSQDKQKIDEESTSMVWPTLGSRTAKEQNRTLTMWQSDVTNLAVQCRERAWFAINDRQTVSVKVNFSELVNTVQRTASWHRDLHIQHIVNEDYNPGIPDAFSIQRSLH